MLGRAGNVTYRDSRGVLQHDGIRLLGLAIVMQHQCQERLEFDTVPMRRFHKFTVGAQR